ncbi:deSI-like protein [Tanacetum coccineum]
MRLARKPIPGWVKRLAKVLTATVSYCNCLLPENIQVAAVRHMLDHATYSDEGSVSGDSSLTMGSEEDDVDHHLLTAPNSDVAFLQDAPEAYIKEALGFPLFECSLIPSRCHYGLCSDQAQEGVLFHLQPKSQHRSCGAVLVSLGHLLKSIGCDISGLVSPKLSARLALRYDVKGAVLKARANPGALLKGFEVCLAAQVQPPIDT